MSIYTLCLLHCLPSNSESLTAALSNAMTGLGIGFKLGGFEDDEKSLLMAEGYSWPAGIEFQLSDDPSRVDSTGLWNESMVEARKLLMNIQQISVTDLAFDGVASVPLSEEYLSSVAQTKFGSAIAHIVDQFGIMGGMIALIEGGIEKVEFCSSNACLDTIFRMFLLPWDCIPNAAFVWPAKGAAI